MWQFLSDQLASNAFLSGGAILGLAGIFFASLRNIPQHLWNWFKRRVVTKVDVPDRDESFKWLNIWLANHAYQDRCRLWTVKTNRANNYSDTSDHIPQVSKRVPKIILSPAPGIHFLFYKRRLMILHRERKENTENNSAGFRETFYFTLFSRNKQIVLDLLEEARQTAHPPSDERVTLLRVSYDTWVEAGKRLPRSLESVILPDNVAEKLLADLTLFQESETWYNERGIPYQRGYLLHGKPGNGKSSLVVALASALRYDICVLNLVSSSMTDERLCDLFSTIPRSSIILIEDIDCIFQQRQKVENQERVTFSGLLNVIDGVATCEGRIIFITTNHVEALDSALVRPGRIDVSVTIDNASRDQMEKLFLRFFPDSINLAKEFAKRGTPLEWSMATLQGHFLKYRNNPQLALTNPILQV